MSESNSETFEIRQHPVLAGFGLFFGVLALVWCILVFVKPPPNMTGQELQYNRLGSSIAAPLLLGLSIYFVRRPALVLRISDEGLWVQKNKILIPWNELAQAEIVSPRDRKDLGGRIAEDVINIAANKRSRDMFLILSLNDEGKSRLNGKDLIGATLRKALKLHESEDVCISPFAMKLSGLPLPDDTVYGLAEYINQRAG